MLQFRRGHHSHMVLMTEKNQNNKSLSKGNRQPFSVWFMRMTFVSKKSFQIYSCNLSTFWVWDNFRIYNIHAATWNEKWLLSPWERLVLNRKLLHCDSGKAQRSVQAWSKYNYLYSPNAWNGQLMTPKPSGGPALSLSQFQSHLFIKWKAYGVIPVPL